MTSQFKSPKEVASAIAMDHAKPGPARKKLELDVLMACSHFLSIGAKKRLVATRSRKQVERFLKEAAVQASVANAKGTLDILRTVYRQATVDCDVLTHDELAISAHAHRRVKELVQLLRLLPSKK